MASVTTTVPHWVKHFAALNPDEVEIIEMTHPSITELEKADQPIESRMGETVFILRKCLTQQMVKALQKKAVPTFPAIHRIATTEKRTRVGSQHYHSWQAVRYQNCTCKYNYSGTRAHKLYHYTQKDPANLHEHQQPHDVYHMLDALWSSQTGLFSFIEKNFVHASRVCPINAVILNKYENGDTIAAHTDDVKLSSQGAHDDLHSGTVVTITLNASGVFFIEPSKEKRKKCS